MSGVGNVGLSVEERLKQLRAELDALQQVKTQEDYDEGERLHNKHNAPWKSGMYSHLEFPPYVYREYPRMLYGLGYPAAVRERAEAEMIPAFGMRDEEKKAALAKAERKIQESTCIVQNEAHYRKMGPGWFESPAGAEAELLSQQRRIEEVAANRAYEDRNMSDKAKREIDAYDEAADHFVTHIPERKRRAKGTRVATSGRR